MGHRWHILVFPSDAALPGVNFNRTAVDVQSISIPPGVRLRQLGSDEAALRQLSARLKEKLRALSGGAFIGGRGGRELQLNGVAGAAIMSVNGEPDALSLAVSPTVQDLHAVIRSIPLSSAADWGTALQALIQKHTLLLTTEKTCKAGAVEGTSGRSSVQTSCMPAQAISNVAPTTPALHAQHSGQFLYIPDASIAAASYKRLIRKARAIDAPLCLFKVDTGLPSTCLLRICTLLRYKPQIDAIISDLSPNEKKSVSKPAEEAAMNNIGAICRLRRALLEVQVVTAVTEVLQRSGSQKIVHYTLALLKDLANAHDLQYLLKKWTKRLIKDKVIAMNASLPSKSIVHSQLLTNQ